MSPMGLASTIGVGLDMKMRSTIGIEIAVCQMEKNGKDDDGKMLRNTNCRPVASPPVK